ncbi:PleD family two-component system response regulator [Lichenibacterium ramalinae]|uniref:diguanylate cyclase n=1 Tax=Lichenibacterium ramalinae TaxID=2316527 RepID=A0A4Q2RDI0_9HYPH|nr:PleD family two-component system response regulator [Lichenibacterium ramalinae]RYB04959.1 PleD family two-component system response regulator [Lichenibacterium ramalinae]
MTARILVVDDVPANVKLLEARLSAEYFEVRTAANGFDALQLAGRSGFDVILLDVMMPGLDGFEVCRRLKSDPVTAHVPVVLVTALDHTADRVRGLEAGADDFLTKPVDELALVARVRSLARFKQVVDELRRQVEASGTLGLQPGSKLGALVEEGGRGRVLLVEDRAASAERLVASLSQSHTVDLAGEPDDALFRAATGGYDLVVISSALKGYDALRICSQIRSLERTRDLPILLLAEPDDRARIVRGLDLGVNDYLLRPVDRDELMARVRSQLRRKRYADRLREIMQASLQMAVTDPLTGLHNRRYLESHLGGLIDAAADGDKPLSLMILDIDHFKSVNDTYGHDAGDEVLKAFAERVKTVIRGVDVLCRLGGEEFIIVMPDTSLEVAGRVAERVRQSVGGTAFPIDKGGRHIPVTVSIGISERRNGREADAMMKRADRALYQSKALGRNRVSADAA